MKRFLSVVKWSVCLIILFFILTVSSSCTAAYKQALVDDYLIGLGEEKEEEAVKSDSTRVEGELIIEPYDLTKRIDDQ